MIALAMVLVGGCIFSMNDDYGKVIIDNGNTGTGEYTISGVLLSKSNAAAAGIAVTLNGGVPLSTVTNNSGEYSFTKVASGSYIVSPETGGYAPMPIAVSGDRFVGTVRSGGHGGNKNGDYSCSQCH